MSDNKYEGWDLNHSSQDNSSPHTSKPTSLNYAVGAGSDPGKRKSRNEDSIFAASSIWHAHTSLISLGLFIVVDSTGAYTNGQVASCGAIQAIIDYILPNIARIDTLQPEACSVLLAEAVQRANEAVHQQNIDLHSREGTDVDVGVMATLTAAMVVDSTAYIANVGDCRTYLYRAGEGLKKVTNDHLMIARLVEDGTLKPDDIYTHRIRHILSRCLGNKPPVEVDIFPVSLLPGDILLLCSPGQWKMVRDPQIEDVISHTLLDPSKAANVLIQTALDNGGKDNVSVIIVLALEAEDEALVPSVQIFTKPDSVHMPQV